MTGARLRWHERLLEVRIARRGVRTRVTLLVDSAPAAEVDGLGLLRLPVRLGDGRAAVVVVVTPLPGVALRTVLLRPAADAPGDDDADPDPDADPAALATAERHPFSPAPGTAAARVQAFEQRHPRLWATRHVVLGVGKALAALLGLAVLLQALVRPLLQWLAGLVPALDLPSIPWPDVDLPSIPWPDVDLPDLAPPGWVAAVLATAKFWVPVLVGVVLAVREARRRRRPPPGEDDPDAHR
ncbi:hypothetical protein [Trujillonella endophytica]|uniref:Uncharacterized protein n=1 Tax=Trujillonella endophytica TaxID=673521 RepID=A0A1H8UNG1_9ACTN|nr:hypothetical protein [Trujillella endophytica]SEP04691.1 hypothetical protein SAMN05660991_02965 [Trujillella endophytica]